MRLGTIHRDGVALIPTVRHAERWWSRLRGLLLREPLCADGSEGLLITPCASVHTLGMAYPIDVVFLDKEGVVLGCQEAVAPARVRLQRGARSALELVSGGIGIHAIKRGDRLVWVQAQVQS